MLLTSFPAGPLQANCYVAARGPGAGCVVVDPGMDAMTGLRQVVSEQNLRPEAILITHGHFDHMWNAQDAAAEYDCPVWIHPADRHLLSDPMAAISTQSAEMVRQQLQLAAPDSGEMNAVPDFTEPADVRDAADGVEIEVDGMTVLVDHAPGHTPGTVFYRIDYDGPEDVSQIMFSGDFLFAGSIGRTDLTGGSHDQMQQSLRDRVLPLADDIVVLPGHGPQTSVGRERVTNPFLAELAPGPHCSERAGS